MRAKTEEKPLIALREVEKSFDTAHGPFQALRGLSLAVGRGRMVAITGKSGSGKSTLLNVIAGIDRVTSGTVEIDGVSVGTLAESRLAAWRGKTIGVVFQFFQLLPTLTVLENVMLPMDLCHTFPRADRAKRALELLGRVGIEDQAGKLPSALSGGQQQRAAIARALANDPPIVVADEPTGNLDSGTAAAIFELFHALSRAGKTVLIVTHERELSTHFEDTIAIADGAIVDDATSASARAS